MRFGISTEVVYLQRSHGWYWCHMKLLPSRRVLCTPHSYALCHFMQSHIRQRHRGHALPTVSLPHSYIRATHSQQCHCHTVSYIRATHGVYVVPSVTSKPRTVNSVTATPSVTFKPHTVNSVCVIPSVTSKPHKSTVYVSYRQLHSSHTKSSVCVIPTSKPHTVNSVTVIPSVTSKPHAVTSVCVIPSVTSKPHTVTSVCVIPSVTSKPHRVNSITATPSATIFHWPCMHSVHQFVIYIINFPLMPTSTAMTAFRGTAKLIKAPIKV